MAEEFTVTVKGDTTIENNITSTYSDNMWTSPYTTSWSYTNTIYMYQIICPRCFETNWGEINKVVTCKGRISKKSCGAKLKAIREKVDYEVAVG